MPEPVGTTRFNPDIERIRREMYQDGGPEDEPCDVCGFDPCRCDEAEAITDALEQLDVKITEGDKP